MKKLLFSLLAVSSILLTSCSEKFEVAAPYKDITVVYGFLDMGDTAHYIRIQKAYLDENKSAISMAQNADSNFFNNISVRIERYRATGNHAYYDSFQLNRVDMTLEGYPKQAGAFFTAPNYAYKFTDALDPQFIYRLKIVHKNTGAIDSADAPVINLALSSFKVPIIDDNMTNLAGMAFTSVLPSRHFDFNGSYVPLPGYNYNNETNPVHIAQAFIRFNWDDSDINTKLHTPRSYDMDAGMMAVSQANNSFEYDIANSSLYAAIGVGMGTAPANVVRLMNRANISVYLSTSDYVNYRNALLIQGNGLTGSEISPVYTNIKGQNVLGLFTSRGMHTGPVTIAARTIDSLIASSLLKHTNLKGTVYH